MIEEAKTNIREEDIRQAQPPCRSPSVAEPAYDRGRCVPVMESIQVSKNDMSFAAPTFIQQYCTVPR